MEADQRDKTPDIETKDFITPNTEKHESMASMVPLLQR
jgi:hypothetical protein